MQTDFISTRNNTEHNDPFEPIRYECKPWWADTAFESLDGRVCVARVCAVSLKYRHRTAEDRGSRYETSPKFVGNFARYTVDLTEQEMHDVIVSKAFVLLPDYSRRKFGERPKSNDPCKYVATKEAIRKALDVLRKPISNGVVALEPISSVAARRFASVLPLKKRAEKAWRRRRWCSVKAK